MHKTMAAKAASDTTKYTKSLQFPNTVDLDKLKIQLQDSVLVTSKA